MWNPPKYMQSLIQRRWECAFLSPPPPPLPQYYRSSWRRGRTKRKMVKKERRIWWGRSRGGWYGGPGGCAMWRCRCRCDRGYAMSMRQISLVPRPIKCQSCSQEVVSLYCACMQPRDVPLARHRRKLKSSRVRIASDWGGIIPTRLFSTNGTTCKYVGPWTLHVKWCMYLYSISQFWGN